MISTTQDIKYTETNNLYWGLSTLKNLVETASYYNIISNETSDNLQSTAKSVTEYVPFVLSSFGIDTKQGLIIEVNKCKDLEKKLRRTRRIERDQYFSRTKNIFLHELSCYSEQQSNAEPPNKTYIPFQQINNLGTNLKLANELLKATLQSVPFSSNNLARSRSLLAEWTKKYGIELNDLSAISEEASEIVSECSQSYMKKWEDSEGSLFTLSKIAAQETCNACIGNCGEIASVALFKGMKMGVWNTLIEEAEIYSKMDNSGDHTVIVIGRDPNSDSKNYKTWGLFAVVLDSWIEEVYPADQIEKKLFDFIERNCMTGKPVLKQFDPLTQNLKVTCGNICTVNDIKKLESKGNFSERQSRVLQKVSRELEKFHHNKTMQKKLEKAITLSEQCGISCICNYKVIKLLKDQVDHFIELYEV